MANPSADGPSGSGTEVLRRYYSLYTTEESEVTLITGVADHIYSVLCVSWHNRNGSLTDTKIEMYVDYNAGGTDLYIVGDQLLGPQETFIFNDKFIIAGTDKLHVKATSSAGTAQMDVWCTYIDQDWT